VGTAAWPILVEVAMDRSDDLGHALGTDNRRRPVLAGASRTIWDCAGHSPVLSGSRRIRRSAGDFQGWGADQLPYSESPAGV